MKKYLFLLLIFLLGLPNLDAQSDRFKKKNKKQTVAPAQTPASEDAPAQVNQEPSIWDKFVFGGGAGFNFGNNTNIFLAPQVGYKVSDDWTVGGGYMYNYTRWNRIWNGIRWEEVNFENQVHGPNIFTNLSFFETLFVGTQVEYLNHDVYIYNFNTGGFDITNEWTPVWFLQGGYMQKLGNKGQMLLGMRINVLHDVDSPYSTSWAPIFQIFF